MSAVDPHGFLPHESKTLLDRQDFVSGFSIRSGDLIMTRANTPELVGEVCLVDHDYPNLMLSDKTLRLVPRSNVDPYLLSEMLQSPNVRQQLQSVATGTGRSMKNISQAKIGELLIAYPLDENATTTNERLLRYGKAIRDARHRHDKSRALAKAASEILLRPVESQRPSTSPTRSELPETSGKENEKRERGSGKAQEISPPGSTTDVAGPRRASR